MPSLSTIPITFQDEDLELLAPAAVSRRLQVSYAFVQLCLDAGCPTRVGHLSTAELLCWLFDHYAAVRALAGLPAAAPMDGLERETEQRLRMANAIFTLLDFGASRTSDEEAKLALQSVGNHLERLLNRA